MARTKAECLAEAARILLPEMARIEQERLAAATEEQAA